MNKRTRVVWCVCCGRERDRKGQRETAQVDGIPLLSLLLGSSLAAATCGTLKKKAQHPRYPTNKCDPTRKQRTKLAAMYQNELHQGRSATAKHEVRPNRNAGHSTVVANAGNG